MVEPSVKLFILIFNSVIVSNHLPILSYVVSELIQPLVLRLSQRDEAMSRLITECWANFVATVSILIFVFQFIIIVHFDIITIYTIASANFVLSIMTVMTFS